MGRKSVKENKNEYQLAREEAGLTRAQAAEEMLISESKLEKIESGKSPAYPDDVMLMAESYKKPELHNYYCSNECPIGRAYIPEIQCIHDLPQITLDLLSKLNTLNREKDRVIDITADGKVSEDEEKDFDAFRKHLDEMSLAIETLKLWADKEIM